MTITIELPDATVAALIDQARTEGRHASELAVEAVTERFGGVSEYAPLEADAVEGLRRGFADLDAGRTLPLETAREEFASAFAARFPEDGE